MELTKQDRNTLNLAQLQQTQNIDLHGRRVVNAGDSVNSQDYITRGELDDAIGGGGSGGAGTPGNLAKFATSTTINDSKAVQVGPLIIIGSGTPVNPGVLDTVREFVVYSDLDAVTTETAAFIQVGIYPTSSPADYEKTGLLVLAYTLDPSVYGGSPVARDTVAIDGRGHIVAGNVLGRAWGGYFEANVMPSADGLGTGIEVSVVNYGTNQTLVDQSTTKTGIGLNTRGANPGTAAIYIVNTWNKGIVAREDALVTSFLDVLKASAFTSMFRVKPTGQMLVGDLPNTGTLSDYTSTFYGVATFRTNITICDSSTNKNVLLLFTDTGTSRHRIVAGHYDTPASTFPISLEINAVQAYTINTDGASLFGWATSPVTIGHGNILVKSYIFVADATSNAHVAVLATDSGTSSVIVGSDKTGSATVYPIIFRIGTDSLWKLNSTGIFNPILDNAYDIGDATHRVRYLYGTGIISGNTSIALVAGGLEFYQSSTLRATISSSGIAGAGSGITDITPANITPGTNTYVLTTVAGVTVWAAPSGGGVTGSGTTSYIPAWSGSSALADSNLYNDGSGQIILGATSSDIGSATTRFIVVGSGHGFLAATASTNASVGSLTVVSGNYVSLSSTISGAGTQLPIVMFVNGSEHFRMATDGSTKLKIAGTLYTLSVVSGVVNAT